ncbi:MAG: glutathione S-transferase N-terminal domain-containing protein [Gammaproteobacteria bacterium]|nr:MAG: glutathione S-transferase N-terminal domain-containing protein [Gammaproteobacteria bacterium]
MALLYLTSLQHGYSVMKWFFKIFFKIIRLIIGPIILFVDKITTPKGVKRPEDEQQKIDQEVNNLVLYQFKTCPFCIKVKRNNKRLSLNIETRDAQHNPTHRQELLQGGGQIKVPCLKIIDNNGKDNWMYESDDILQYLQGRFAA